MKRIGYLSCLSCLRFWYTNRSMAAEKPVTDTEGLRTNETPNRHFSRRFVLLSLIIILVAAAGVGTYFVLSKPAPKPPVQLKKGQAISSQVDRLDDASAKALAAYDGKVGDNVDAVYATALALSREDKQPAAIAKFQEIIQAGKMSYYMYEDYGLVQGRAGHPAEAVKAFDKASELLKQDSSVSPEVKASEQRYIKNKAAGFKEEAGQS